MLNGGVSQFVPKCPVLSPFVLFCPDLSPFRPQDGQKRTNEDKTGHLGTNWETPPFSIYPHLALLKLSLPPSNSPKLSPRIIAIAVAVPNLVFNRFRLRGDLALKTLSTLITIHFQNYYTHKITIFKLFRSLQLQFSGPTGINFRYSYSFVGLTGICLYSHSSVQLHKKKRSVGLFSENYSYSYIKKWFAN